jgi:hypothetical protein
VPATREAHAGQYGALPQPPSFRREPRLGLAMAFHLCAVKRMALIADDHGANFAHVFLHTGQPDRRADEAFFEAVLARWCNAEGIPFLSARATGGGAGSGRRALPPRRRTLEPARGAGRRRGRALDRRSRGAERRRAARRRDGARSGGAVLTLGAASARGEMPLDPRPRALALDIAEAPWFKRPDSGSWRSGRRCPLSAFFRLDVPFARSMVPMDRRGASG